MEDVIPCCETCKFSVIENDIWECRFNPPQILIEESEDNPEECDICSIFPMVTPYMWCGQYIQDARIEVCMDENVTPDVISVKQVNGTPMVTVDMTKEQGCDLL